MDEINPEMEETDVALVVGANDTVNPGALEDSSSPIYGMPVIEAWKAKTCIVLKRSMATGYAGVENPLFFKENCRMLFGDAKKSVDGVLAHLK
jgi:NAD(P) transhydrogenase subunit beta